MPWPFTHKPQRCDIVTCSLQVLWVFYRVPVSTTRATVADLRAALVCPRPPTPHLPTPPSGAGRPAAALVSGSMGVMALDHVTGGYRWIQSVPSNQRSIPKQKSQRTTQGVIPKGNAPKGLSDGRRRQRPDWPMLRSHNSTSGLPPASTAFAQSLPAAGYNPPLSRSRGGPLALGINVL